MVIAPFHRIQADSYGTVSVGATDPTQVSRDAVKRPSKLARPLVTQPHTPLKPDLFKLTVAAVRDGLTKMRAVMKKKTHLFIPREWGWREIQMRENGMPSFSKDEKSAPLDYSYLFGGPNSEIDRNSIASFRLFVDYLVADTEYQDTERPKYRPDISQDDLLKWVRLMADHIPAMMVERYERIYPNTDFDAERFLPLYLRWEEGLFAEEVAAEIVIPLLMIHAEFDEFRLGPEVAIRRMDNPFQLARAALLDSTRHVHEWAAAAATHAIVIEGRTLSRERRHALTGYPWELNDSDLYPISLVDKAIAAIRIATGFDLGYAQVLIHYRYANSDHSDKALPDVHGIPVRRYPISFDHWGWLKKIPVITAKDAELVATLFGTLERLPDSSTLAIAARRINDCYLRDRDDDAILDGVIAFETLLSDGDHHELTHKLALRVAALLKLPSSPSNPPVDGFKDVKRIYQYRSKLVHGKLKEAEKLVQKHYGGDSNRPLVLTRHYLRLIMCLLIQNECYRKPEEIDRLLLIGDTGMGTASDDESE